MTREDQIREALKEPRPKPGEANQCREDIEYALDRIEMNTRHRGMESQPQSKSGCAAINRFAHLLREVQKVQARLPTQEKYLSQKIADKVVKAFIYIKGAQNIPKRVPAPTGHKQRACVEAARALLLPYRHRHVTTGKGSWDRLSAVLYGHPDVSLQRHLVVRSGKKRSSR
jgi:hypothetical protein